MRFERRRGALAKALLVAAIALGFFGCASSDRPNFSGTWELDVARSNFGPVPGPSKSTQVIEHQEPHLRLTADSEGFMGETHVELEMITDGSETEQTVDGRPRKMQTYWDGAALVTEWEVANPGQARFAMVDRRTLSQDGETMTVKRQLRSNGADWEQTAVFTRKRMESTAPAGSGGPKEPQEMVARGTRR
jgi:hypothetical protein